MDKNKKSKKNIFLSIIIILIILVVLLFTFRSNIEAQYKGVDVKYIENSKYCEQDSDCAQRATCDSVNIYNYNPSGGFCKEFVNGSNCIDNKCSIIPFVGNSK